MAQKLGYRILPGTSKRFDCQQSQIITTHGRGSAQSPCIPPSLQYCPPVGDRRGLNGSTFPTGCYASSSKMVRWHGGSRYATPTSGYAFTRLCTLSVGIAGLLKRCSIKSRRPQLRVHNIQEHDSPHLTRPAHHNAPPTIVSHSTSHFPHNSPYLLIYPSCLSRIGPTVFN